MPRHPYRGNARHPVHALLAEAAYAGREATEEELAELQLSAEDPLGMVLPLVSALLLALLGEKKNAAAY